MIKVHDVEQGSPEWHALRSGKYTGANADKLLAYASQIKVVNGVASSYAITEITGFGGNFFTRRGHQLEDEALELYATITGHRVSRPGFVTNDDYTDCGYSPDGHDDGLEIPLEVKCFEETKHLRMYKGDVSMKILAQIHFGQLIWEKHGARLLIYNPNFAKKELNGPPNPNYDPRKAFKIIDVKYNRNIQNNFKRILRKEVVHAI
jgi:hypothetical protein